MKTKAKKPLSPTVRIPITDEEFAQLKHWCIDHHVALGVTLADCARKLIRKKITGGQLSNEAKEARAPRPPEELVDALQDRVHSEAGTGRVAKTVTLKLLNRCQKAEYERDLAIAHDRQPYPTAEAYDLACKALNKHRDHARRLQKAFRTARDIYFSHDDSWNDLVEGEFEQADIKAAK
jgi:hypothetical protein